MCILHSHTNMIEPALFTQGSFTANHEPSKYRRYRVQSVPTLCKPDVVPAGSTDSVKTLLYAKHLLLQVLWFCNHQTCFAI